MGDPRQEFSGSEIAIIGMAARFPGAPDVETFWRNLRDGVESTTFFTDEELLAAGVDAETLSSPNFVKAKPILRNIDLFDAAFFGLSSREAEVIDPQHRLYLENVWEALENAGYDPESYKGSIGLYAGVGMSSYLFAHILSNPEVLKTVGVYQAMLYNLPDSLATRVAYKLNLRGPCYTVQTFCSTSLVAVHLACQSLLNYECDMSVAGGVSICVPQEGYYFEDGGVLSPDGRCRAFDASAQGTISASGLGSVVLKRLKDALADGDTIHGMILGTAINNDGSAKVSYTAPSVTGQAQVIVEAISNAGIQPDDITYIETHGTATALGDPAEVAALTRAFRTQTREKTFCALGSVKTNIGHTEAAAGIAGLIKAVLALKNRQIPPSLHFEKPNPEIDFASSPFYVNTKLQDWTRNGKPLYAGVSSFGMGGTNAHAVLREPPAPTATDKSRSQKLLLLSARTSAALEAVTDNLVSHLRMNPELDLADVAYTLQVGRRPFSYRRTVVCSNNEDAISTLESRDAKRVFTTQLDKRDVPVVFMFSGQGAQYVQMGRDLYREEEAFRSELDRCSEILKPELGLDLRDVLYANAADEEHATELLRQTQFTQPALFAVEYALAKLWMKCGVVPKAMIGHSIGEYVAACLSGVFSLEAALALVAERGRLMQALPTGSMLSVSLSAAETEATLGRNGFSALSIAAINGPSSTVVSGTTTAIGHLEEHLLKNGVAFGRLHTSHAFHSAMMDPILDSYRDRVRQVKLNSPQLPFVSNVTGRWIKESEATDPNYWSLHLRESVRFTDGLVQLLNDGQRVLLEVGPGRTLSTLAKRHFAKSERPPIFSSLRHPQEPQSDLSYWLNTFGQLWSAGSAIDWTAFYSNEKRRRLPLPTYPFERRRYWVEPPKELDLTPSLKTQLSKRLAVDDWTFVPSWKRVPLPRKAPAQLSGRKESWLLFLDDCNVGSSVAKALVQRGHTVVTVRAGSGFARTGASSFEIDPERRDDYTALLRDVRNSGEIPKNLIHFGGVTARPQLEGASSNCFYGLLWLAQAIGEQDITSPLRLWVVTNNLQAITGDEELQPEKAPILAACKVIPQEYQNISCHNVDIEIDNSTDITTAQLLRELTSDSADAISAYRNGLRWTPSLESIRLDAPTGTPSRLRQNGAYLITGGMGGIGLALAGHLARIVQAKVILVSRSVLPSKDKWDEFLSSHGEDDRVSRKIRKLRAIEDLGGEVLVCSADVSNADQMRAVVCRAIDRFGEIHGVIHAAGIAGGGIIQYKTREIADSVMRPKIEGARVLQQVFKDTKLDFFVLCSSLASIAGGFGQVDYCAANSFLDLFAQRNSKETSTFTTAINWDVWGEVGMAVETEVPADMRARRLAELKTGIATVEGLEVFNRILDSDLTQVVVATKDIRGLFMKQLTETKIDAVDNQPDAVALYPRPELHNNFVEPRNELEAAVAQIWTALLGVEKVGVHDNFFDLGGHSLLGTQLVSRLHQKFDVYVPLRSLFEAPTVDGVAGLIARLRYETESDDAKILQMIEALPEDQVEELLK